MDEQPVHGEQSKDNLEIDPLLENDKTVEGDSESSIQTIAPRPEKEPPGGSSQILSVAGDEGKTKVSLTPTQQVGVWVLIGIGSAIFVVMIVLLYDWYCNAPQLTVPSSNGTNSQIIKESLESIQTLNDLSLQRVTGLFDLLVIRALLPIFTTVLGYIFGRQSEKSNQDNQL